jgi:succinate dehydrogenase / fumarate reductase cytochrome b subunit
MSAAPRSRPKYYDLNLLHLPAPGLLSIFHRISGVAMVLFLIPGLLFLLQLSLGDEAGFRSVREIFGHWFAKLILIGFVWAFVHHFLAGIRYLLLDVHLGITKEAAQSSARWVLGLGLALTALIIGVAS